VTNEQILANIAKRKAEEAEREANGGYTLAEIAAGKIEADRRAKTVADIRELVSEAEAHLLGRAAAKLIDGNIRGAANTLREAKRIRNKMSRLTCLAGRLPS
jgi:hypothetical protein